jgi:hypothetical protein
MLAMSISQKCCPTAAAKVVFEASAPPTESMPLQKKTCNALPSSQGRSRDEVKFSGYNHYSRRSKSRSVQSAPPVPLGRLLMLPVLLTPEMPLGCLKLELYWERAGVLGLISAEASPDFSSAGEF